MKEDFSEEKIRRDCPFCDSESWALKHKLEETQNFWIVCNSFPLCEGHIMVIPKNHLACAGEFNDELMEEFGNIYQNTKNFVENNYGAVSTFEHGKIGQTVFHSHVHIFPYEGNLESIVPEGNSRVLPLDGFGDVKKIYFREGHYLFLSIGNKKWEVDAGLANPGFFLARFAKAMGRDERTDWKAMSRRDTLMQEVSKEIENLTQCWATGRLAGIGAAK